MIKVTFEDYTVPPAEYIVWIYDEGQDARRISNQIRRIIRAELPPTWPGYRYTQEIVDDV